MNAELCDCGHGFEPYHNNSSHGTACAAADCPCQLFHQHRQQGTSMLAARLADAKVEAES